MWQRFQVDSLNFIYLIECQMCGKWYVGQTKNILLERLKQHIYHIEHHTKRTELCTHFRLHGIENLIIGGLESGTGWTTSQRLAAERRWISRLSTCLPRGLNEVAY